MPFCLHTQNYIHCSLGSITHCGGMCSSNTTPPPHTQVGQGDHAAERDMGSEYARQREHLERSVASLRKKLAKDTEIHRKDNIRVMQVIIIITILLYCTVI